MAIQFETTNEVYNHVPADHLFGNLNNFFWDADDRPAAEQLNDRYNFGGGFSPLDGWTLSGDWEEPGQAIITYPEDTPLEEIGRATLRDETLIFFEHSWLAIIQKDGSFKVTRVD